MIAEQLGVSPQQISYDLRQLRQRYMEVQERERADRLGEMEEQYREIMKEAWEAWERSKKPKRRKVVFKSLFDDKPEESGEEDEGESRDSYDRRLAREIARAGRDPTKLQETIESHLPGAEYLKTIQSCLLAIRELHGLDAPKKVDAHVETFNWDILATAATPPKPDRIEARIAEVLAKPGLPVGLKELPASEQVLVVSGGEGVVDPAVEESAPTVKSKVVGAAGSNGEAKSNDRDD